MRLKHNPKIIKKGLGLLIIFFSTFAFSQDVEKEIFPIAEEMPRFPGCEDEPTKGKKRECANQKLMEYIYSNLKYPEEAMKNGIEGRGTVRFVVTEEGKIDNVEIVRDIGGGCGQAAVQVLEIMNYMPDKWIPGKQGGRNVNVYFTMPVIFKL